MKKIILALVLFIAGFVLNTAAQTTKDSSTILRKQAEKLKKAKEKVVLEQSLKNAKATDLQKQQILEIQKTFATKAKLVKRDSSLSEDQKNTKLKELNTTKNAQYKQVLGEDLYREYNRLKVIPVEAQLNIPKTVSNDDITKTNLESIGLSQTQVQQFIDIKKSYKKKIKDIKSDTTLSVSQQKKQLKQLLIEKNKKYKQAIGEANYKTYNKMKREDNSDN